MIVWHCWLHLDQVIPHGAVASTSTECSKIGTDILQDHGSAVDAAIATVICEGVVSSHLTGLGGYVAVSVRLSVNSCTYFPPWFVKINNEGFPYSEGFMIYRDNKKKDTVVLDFRSVAPIASSEAMYDSSPNDKVIVSELECSFRPEKISPL